MYQQVSLESDPRPNLAPPPPPPDIEDLRDHNPWAGGGDDSDPEEADIEEHVTHGPNGNITFTRTVRTTSSPLFTNVRRTRDSARGPLGPEDPDNVMRNFQDMIGNLMGPQFRHGQPGRSGPDTLFNPPQFTSGFRMGGNGGPTIMGGRVTFTSSSSSGGPLRPRDLDTQQPTGPQVDDLSTYAPPSPPNPADGRQIIIVGIRARPDHLASIIGSLFGPPGQPAHEGPRIGGMPPGLQGLFAAMLNPINARSGDAVYTQEALDQIISTLMEQHPTSNAPGPAAPDAIAALPKKQLSEKELGPEGKGECSVCMDDVTIGDEVVFLPCMHWFHEVCASMWLGEHNTCPICRKGIDIPSSPSPAATGSPTSHRTGQTPSRTHNEHRARRLSLNTYRTRPQRENETVNTNPTSARNEARLDAIRNTAGRFSTSEPSPPHSPPVPNSSRPNTDTNMDIDEDNATPMTGWFTRRASEMSGNERDRDRDRDYSAMRSTSRRSSQSGSGASGNGSGSGGVSGWIRDRFGSGRRD
jgi:E3 ubiquitin-protein ligase RNF115/126